MFPPGNSSHVGVLALCSILMFWARSGLAGPTDCIDTLLTAVATKVAGFRSGASQSCSGHTAVDFKVDSGEPILPRTDDKPTLTQLDRAAEHFLTLFRLGTLGKLTLEPCPTQ
eukprot:SAG31_NODE_5394_length_2565_cov_1.929035_2_plen_113_part_00